MLFWELFLIQESYVCDDRNIDCFYVISPTNVTPITNCKLYEESDEEGTVLCFTFVYRITTGFAATGGMITATILMTKITSKNFLKIYSMAINCSNLIFKIVNMLHFIVNGVLFIFCYIVVPSLFISYYPFLLKKYKILPSHVIRGLWVLLTVLALSYIPWSYFIIKEDISDHKETEEKKTECCCSKSGILIKLTKKNDLYRLSVFSTCRNYHTVVTGTAKLRQSG